MKNNKGFGKFEIITMITVLLVIFAFIFYLLLQGADKQKFDTMKENALTLSKTVGTNTSSFHYGDVVYLDEVIEQGFTKGIKNPFGSGTCDVSQSRINIIDGRNYATLRCGNYLIDESDFADKETVPIYEVSDWQREKIDGEDVQERILYNCLNNGEEVFDEYYEELYFVYRYNKEFAGNAYFANQIKNDKCEVSEMTFYRTHKEVS